LIYKILNLFFNIYISYSNWVAVAESLNCGRSGKQCRERYHHHLQPNLKKGDWSKEEDNIITIMQSEIGNQWSKIARELPGRTDNAVKNRWHAAHRGKFRVEPTRGGGQGVCFAFKKGECSKGTSCRFSHGTEPYVLSRGVVTSNNLNILSDTINNNSLLTDDGINTTLQSNFLDNNNSLNFPPHQSLLQFPTGSPLNPSNTLDMSKYDGQQASQSFYLRQQQLHQQQLRQQQLSQQLHLQQLHQHQLHHQYHQQQRLIREQNQHLQNNNQIQEDPNLQNMLKQQQSQNFNIQQQHLIQQQLKLQYQLEQLKSTLIYHPQQRQQLQQQPFQQYQPSFNLSGETASLSASYLLNIPENNFDNIINNIIINPTINNNIEDTETPMQSNGSTNSSNVPVPPLSELINRLSDNINDEVEDKNNSDCVDSINSDNVTSISRVDSAIKSNNNKSKTRTFSNIDSNKDNSDKNVESVETIENIASATNLDNDNSLPLKKSRFDLS
jgi:hypothetical protein